MKLDERKAVTKAHVKSRVEDWKRRVSNLYTSIETWLKDHSEYTLQVGRPVQMYEQLMAEVGIQPQNINTADLFRDMKPLLTLKPKGLWVIGANGLIDVISERGSHILVDRSDEFKEPKWYIYTSDKRNGTPFTKAELLKLLQHI